MTDTKTLNEASLLDIAEELTRRLRALESEAESLRFQATDRRADGRWGGTSLLMVQADNRKEVADDLEKIVETLIRTSRGYRAIMEGGA